jgi:hypothetical protein
LDDELTQYPEVVSFREEEPLMSLLADNERTVHMQRTEPPRPGGAALWFVWPLVLSVVILIGSAAAFGAEPRPKGESAKKGGQAQPAKDATMTPPAKETAPAQPAQSKETPASGCSGCGAAADPGSCGAAAAQESGCGAKTDGPPVGTPKRIGEPPNAAGGSGAKWVCPETTITPPPLWRGQEIECAWMIRNDGTGNLDIKAKGG